MATPVTARQPPHPRRPRRCTAGASHSSTRRSPSCSPPAPPSASTWPRARSSRRRRGRPGCRSTTTPEAAVREIARARPEHLSSGRTARRSRRPRRAALGRQRPGGARQAGRRRPRAATSSSRARRSSTRSAAPRPRATARSTRRRSRPTRPGALTRRMAYELALTTFHYVPEVQNVAVLLPAVIKGQKARMLVLSRSENKDPKSLDAAITPIRKIGKPTSRGGAQDRRRDGSADLPLRGHRDERQPARLPDHAAAHQGHRGGRR